ncbi:MULTISPECIES: hypothetical protein [unclassified Pseudactinotalea]|uniref:hypothetical protein n=1 Tax=unclassified Pseudactinotalea TaxID=2649176 RepID=UPI003C7E4FFD
MSRTDRALPRTIMAALAVLVAVLVLSIGLPAVASGTPATPLAQAPEDPGSQEDLEGETPENVAHRPVVLLGVAGLAWEDITSTTPNLGLLAQESKASLIVRSVRASACPADGWLGLSAGNRAGDLDGRCRILTEPGEDGVVPGWQDYLDSAAELSYRARPGTFGQALADQQITATGIGPGAAIALADPEGVPADHRARAGAGGDLIDQVSEAVAATDLLVIDAGSLRPLPTERRERFTDENQPMINPMDPEVYRAEQLELLDRRVGSVLTGLDRAGVDPIVVLAGLADDGSAGLRVLSITGADGEVGLGISAATRQSGYVMVTDVFPSLLSMLDGEPVGGDVIGSALRIEPTDLDATERREQLIEQAVHAQAVRPITPTYYLVLVLMNLALFAALAVGLKRPAAERVREFLQRRVPAVAARLTAFTVHRRKVLRGLRIAALSIAALPVSSFLANMMPWWRSTPPALGLVAYIALFVAAIVTIALVGPWRRHVLGAPTVVAGITAAVLTVDIATGARLQVDAVMGVSTLVAGRMYGMNNTAFTLFTVSTLMVTITLANHLVQRDRRVLAGVITGVLGVAAAIFDGAPGLGADFGGPPALLPAFALLALMAAGIRLSVLRVGVVLGGSAVATMAFAFVDWLRPVQDRTHLGAFFQTVLDGGLWDVVWRKLGQNLAILFGNTPLTLLALSGVLTVVFVFARPIRGAIRDPGIPDSLSRGTPLAHMAKAAPMLPAGIIAIAVGLGIGMAVNDSGVAIPAVGVAVSVPLLVAASCTWMLGLSSTSRVKLGAYVGVPAPATTAEEDAGGTRDALTPDSRPRTT